MSLNLSQDWQVIDDLQTITYFSKVAEGAYLTGSAVSNVYWEELGQSDYLKNPALLEQTARAAHLWTNQLVTLSGAPIVPKLDDQLVDSSLNYWFVTKVDFLDLDHNGVQRYRALCLLTPSTSGTAIYSGFQAGSGFAGLTGTFGG